MATKVIKNPFNQERTGCFVACFLHAPRARRHNSLSVSPSPPCRRRAPAAPGIAAMRRLRGVAAALRGLSAAVRPCCFPCRHSLWHTDGNTVTQDGETAGGLSITFIIKRNGGLCMFRLKFIDKADEYFWMQCLCRLMMPKNRVVNRKMAFFDDKSYLFAPRNDSRRPAKR